MDVIHCPDSPLTAPQNFKVTMEMDELQSRLAELCDLNADLQVLLLYIFLFVHLPFSFVYLCLPPTPSLA